jgi:hypothetical protein
MHGPVERRLVGQRGFVVPADLANELECGVVQFLVGGLLVRAAEPLDVPAHP